MELMEIIRKAAAGEALTPEERAQLAGFRPGNENSAELEKRNRELESRLEELEQTALSEPERLRRKYDAELAKLRETLKNVGAERDAAKQEIARIGFRSRVDRIAQEQGFSDADYLEYGGDRPVHEESARTLSAALPCRPHARNAGIAARSAASLRRTRLGRHRLAACRGPRNQ